jgi:hypothetical protein
MPRRHERRRVHHRRGTSHRPRKFTLLKAMKIAIGVGPIAGVVVSDITTNPNQQGIQNAVGDITSAYTGFDVATGKFQFSNLAVGYVPLLGAWAFGKVASRVLRV